MLFIFDGYGKLFVMSTTRSQISYSVKIFSLDFRTLKFFPKKAASMVNSILHF